MISRLTATVLLASALLPAAAAPAFAGAPSVRVDGSSTVYPIAEAVAEEFQKAHRDVRVTVGIAGTGGGFKKFCTGEVDVVDASRPIKQTEVDACAKSGIQYVELPVAYDGIAVVVNPRNTWAATMTVAELRKIWEPAAQRSVMRWSQIRPGWPDKPIRLFGPGVDSGTYDYFTEAVVGKEHSSRGDYTSSEDDNVLVQGVAGDTYSLGYFGFAYYQENRNRVKAVGVVAATGKAMLPTHDSIRAGTYAPLSRPLFVYASVKAAARPEVRQFVEFFLDKGAPLVSEVGFVPLPAAAYKLARERFDGRITGSVFGGHGSQVGVSVEKLLAAEKNRTKGRTRGK